MKRDNKYALREQRIHEWDSTALAQREARIRNYYNSDMTGFFPFRVWPAWAQRILLSTDRSRHDRYQLFYWLMRNGASPALRRHAVLVLNVPAPVLHAGDWGVEELIGLQGQLETARSDHVDEMEKQLRDGYFDSHGGRWYDLTMDRVLEPGPNGPQAVAQSIPFLF